MQDEFRQRLKERLALPQSAPAGRFSGRGIVTCAGGPRYFTCVFVLIWIVRRVFGSQLPIQVWHLGAVELSEGMRAILEEEGVEVVDAETVIARHPARVARGWPLKPYAIAHSRFQEVLFLDADTVPLVDPAAVFDWSLYRDSGLLLWPDLIDIKAENPVWAKLGLEAGDCISVDSGILAVDKARAFAVLDLAILLNEHWRELYDLLYGDKDTFLLASRLLGFRPAMIPHRPFDFDYDLVQRDPEGDAFLHHRTHAKWSLKGRNHPMAAPALDQDCAAALAELERRWSGVVFHAPERSATARAAERTLIATRRFDYTTSTTGARPLELLSGGRVGEGRAECEQHWAVVERDGKLVLQLFSESRLHVELLELDEGSWHGGAVVLPHFGARLAAASAAENWPHRGADRIVRGSADVVAGLLAAAVTGAGYDEALARDLAAALSLVNGAFDDVPEQLNEHSGALDPRWRDFVSRLAGELAPARDRRVALTSERARHPVGINPAHYQRVL
jgi:hypothetical protein